MGCQFLLFRKKSVNLGDMQTNKSIFLILTAAILASCCQNQITSELRAPSYPLVTIDPYTSAWSPCDHLYDAQVEHWTGSPYPFIGVINVDGRDYRFLGKEKTEEFRAVAAGAREHPWTGFYSTDKGRSWQKGQGGFGPEGRKPMTSTFLKVNDLRVRREIALSPEQAGLDLYVLCTSQGSSEFYAGGIKICESEERQEFEFKPVPREVLEKAAADGVLVLEGRSVSERNNALIDLGLYERRTFNEAFPETAVQTRATVLPMNTIYDFTCGPVDLELTFTAPLFLDDRELVSRPVNYITYEVRSNDGKPHKTTVSFEAGREWTEDYAIDENSVADNFEKDGISFVRSGCTDQNPLWKSGDGVRIDWGRLYLAAESKGTVTVPSEDGDIVIARDLGKARKASGMIMIGYDDIYSIQYFGNNLRPYWNKDGKRQIEDEFADALKEYDRLMELSATFDRNLMTRAAAVGGQKYAELCALAYRQAVSAHKLVEAPDGDLLWFSKENNSNGSIGTVDVTYPSVPLFLLYNTDLAEGMLNPIFHYSESSLWTKPFPAHDVGRYPLANGQRYGADMPVEEAGNMLILTAAICRTKGDVSYAEKHWETLSGWTEYLLHFGLDPENQLCTDDFAGRSAHNINLSAKAILGIASYGMLAGMKGDKATEDEYIGKAREMAAEWEKMAFDEDHYKLAFDIPGSWSQKYNIVWDRILGLDIFPSKVMETEIPYYLTKQEKYGLPLDSRSSYTKTDWILWTATMADDDRDFEAFVAPVWDFYNETVDRIPMGDWVWSDKPEHVQFKARSVVGGLFIKILEEKASEKK